MKNNTGAYTWFGIILGLLFPVFGTYFALTASGLEINLDSIIQIQQEETLLWIIDTAPLFLGIAFYVVGRLNAKLRETNAKQEEIIEEKTQRFVEKNKELEAEIEDRISTEKQLILAKEDAERAKRAEELFLANMSHELRTPLNGVVGFTRLLLGTSLERTQNEYVNTIQESANHLLAIINDILEISKIKAGEIEFESVPMSPTKVVMNAVNTFKVMSNTKQIALYEEIDRKIPPYILGDQTRLNQILLNLINNGVKFTDDGFVRVRADLLSEDERKAKIKFSVEDSGIGIPQDRIEQIFKSFKQAAADTTRKFGGTGLGLAICKNMVELQGGRIYVESKVNEGSIFSFELEFRKAGPSEMVEQSKGAFETKDIGNVHLLLVEDNKINVKLAENVFKKWGADLNYDVAKNGKEAVDMHEKNNYNIILMDLQMPVMDGFEATRFIRQELPSPQSKTPIIALTADVMVSEKTRAYDAGIDDYITKPFDANKLFATIAKFVS